MISVTRLAIRGAGRSFSQAADRFFGISEKRSSVGTEVLAGVSTFLSLAYIFVVNPALLGQAGADRSAVLFATVVTSALATLLMGVWARLPFVLAPGMETNSYVAFFVVGSLGFTWREALGACFWSGVIFVGLTLLRIRERIIEAIPERMKAGLSLSVGVFLGLVALRIAGLFSSQAISIAGLTSPLAMVFYISVASVLLFDRLQMRTAVLGSIALGTVLCHVLGVSTDAGRPVALSSGMLGAVGEIDLTVITRPRIWSVVLILFLIDFYGSVAKFIGLSRRTTILERGRVPRLKQALLIDGAATCFGAAVGTSCITTYVESGVGIGVGGRTGVTSIVCATLMLSCLLAAPLLSLVPLVATAGALVLVGIKLCPSVAELRACSFPDLSILLLMQLVVVATFAIDRAMLAGFLAYIVLDVCARRAPNPYAVASAILLVLGTWLQAR